MLTGVTAVFFDKTGTLTRGEFRVVEITAREALTADDALAAGVLAPWGIVLPATIGAVMMSLSTVIVAVNAPQLRRARL